MTVVTSMRNDIPLTAYVNRLLKLIEVIPMVRDYPKHWIPGQLLDLKKFTDGSFRATLLGEDYDPKKANGIEFDSSHAAQSFVSDWYSPGKARIPA